MASIEFIQKRIEGKKKAIADLEKKLDRIQKAKDSNWEVNPYWYSERDLNITLKEIASAGATLKKYEDDLAKEIEKSKSRNVPAILEFLEMWKDHVRDYYQTQFEQYLVEREEYYAADHEYVEWFNYRRRNDPDYKAKEDAHRELRESFHRKWNFIVQYVDGSELNMKKLNKDLDEEAKRKYDNIIERTNEIVGEITDASDMKIGGSGELDGYIKGTRGTAHVHTIGAGGYNIQCFHFRVLVHKVK